MLRATNMFILIPEMLLHFSTVYSGKRDMLLKWWRAIHDGFVELYDIDEVHAIDAGFVDRIQAIQHYVRRKGLTFETAKTKQLDGYKTSKSIDIHWWIIQLHDGYCLVYHLGRCFSLQGLIRPLAVVISSELLTALLHSRPTAHFARMEAVGAHFERVIPLFDVVSIVTLEPTRKSNRDRAARHP